MLTTPWGWTFDIWQLFALFIHVINQEQLDIFLKIIKQMCIFSPDYMINHNEHEDQNEILYHADTA